MDPKISKKTQDTLGKIIKKPPLTEKLLGKPPFRFLHDVTTSVIKTTGFMQGLFTEDEMNSENVKEKDAKIAFLQKALDMVSAVTGKTLSAKPIKIVAGHEPEKTNEFLQALAEAVNKNVDNDEYVRKVLKTDKKDDRKERSKEKVEKKEVEDTKEKKEINGKDMDRSKDREKSRDREKDKERHKDREKEKSQDKEKHKDREKDTRSSDKSKEKEERPKDRSREHRDREDRHRDKEERHKEDKAKEKGERQREERPKESSKKGESDKSSTNTKDKESPECSSVACVPADKDQHEEKENASPELNPDSADQKKSVGLQRPTSAKGSRRRREAQNHTTFEDEEFQKPAASTGGDGDLPPQVVAARQLTRPSSARPAPPRPKQEVIESEPTMRLGSGQPTNLIVDNEDDEDEHFLVEEASAPLAEPDFTTVSQPEGDDSEHGALVKKMLESKKDLESGNKNQIGTGKKTEIERPSVSDAQRRKQRELVQKEVEKLRGSIQSLTRSANPLGKVMDYVQEDLDSMQQELDKWREENAQHALELKREMNVTDRAVEPLKQQLTELERAIKDQLDQIAATKANIIKNDQKIQKMLHGISSS
ncbi:TRAF3-interacting protein 1-like isoform X3 [Biomphalaria glabrata]|uniref:TRAF3-interacting protein 1 n=1 Tax=Biomphalaria glabrata TaxID=6526 RepID=A0A9W2YAR1_BIOGL|nr:TRAF3-interacting protein 1-like isoform X3 [Biomphalaria glabrata]